MPTGKWKYCILESVWPNTVTDEQIDCPKITPTKGHSGTNSRMECLEVIDKLFCISFL